MEVREKSETVDPEVRAYVHSLVNAVGGQSTLDDRYAIGDDALAVLNDLLRWLKLYDEKTNRFDVKRCLAEANLVKGDLLEILALWPEEAQENKVKAKLALGCLQLLVPLTWPIELDDFKTTRNHLRHMPYIQLAQVGYKRAILQYEDAKILRTAVRIGLPAMAQERRERTKREESILKLMLYLFRNIAMITQPQNLPSQGDENEISRSTTIDAFHEQDVFSLLLTIGSGANDEFQEQDVVVLETIFHLLKGVDAQKLFMQQEQLNTHETDELQSLMRKEKAMLNSYNKHAPTRHQRFGTMLWVKRGEEKYSTVTGQNSITNRDLTLQQMDASKKWDKPKHRGKIVIEDFKPDADFVSRVELTESARKHLRIFVEDFLDSSFNPLFSSIRKAIERDNERIGEDNRRQYFYLIAWFLRAEAARQEEKKGRSARKARGGDFVSATTNEDNTFAYVAAVLDQETLVLLNRQMQQYFDEKKWTDLHATILSFTQILLTVQAMAESNDEEDQEIAENIQNRIFYEETTHDRIVQVLRSYSNQGFAYLDAVTECAHVFVRMLEAYSKQNVDLQIRSKRRARKKKREANKTGDTEVDQGVEDDDMEAGEDDEREAQLTVSERKFDFARFGAKLMSQPCVNTFVSLLHFYAELDSRQLKRCHRYLYRLAFKNEMAVLLFRVDILQLLNKIIKGPQGLDPAIEGFKEWEQLVQQIFRRCIKWLERETEGDGWREAAVVEMLFSKVPATLFYLQNGYERVIERRPPRPPADLEVKASVEAGKKIGVVVSVLLEQGKADTLDWIKKELKKAATERQAWEDERAAKSSLEKEIVDGEYQDMERTRLSAPTIFIGPDNDERKTALFKDKFLRLLLTTLGLERFGATEDMDAVWSVPSELSTEQIQDALEKIKETEFEPMTFEEGKTAQDLIRNKSAPRQDATFSDEGSEADDDEALFPPNLREKRKATDGEDQQPKKRRRLTRRNQTELTEEQLAEKAEERKRKERERNRKIKSTLYITASDDESDEERDAEFFRLEEQRRKKMKGVIREQLRKEASRARKSKKKDVPDIISDGGEEDIESAVDSDFDYAVGGKKGTSARDVDAEMSSTENDDDLRIFSESEDSGREENAGGVDESGEEHQEKQSTNAEETPSTSPLPSLLNQDKDLRGNGLPLSELPINTAEGLGNSSGGLTSGDVASEDDDEGPLLKPRATQRRGMRAGFVIDSDSE